MSYQQRYYEEKNERLQNTFRDLHRGLSEEEEENRKDNAGGIKTGIFLKKTEKNQ